MSREFNVNEIRKDFPIFQNREMIYLDSSATTQKPYQVVNAVTDFYQKYNANPLRGLYELGQTATEMYDAAREKGRQFLHAKSTEEIIFTRNATESLNLVAYSYGDMVLRPGDEILVSIMEHHSNMLPWQQAAKRTGAVVKYLECDSQGKITAEDLKNAITEHTRIFVVTQVSNVLGIPNDIKAFAKICHEHGIAIVSDGAQSVPHMPVDVQDLDVDFLAFSGHKMLGPMGIGVLYGKKEHLKEMPPFLTGGEMIDSVNREGAVFAQLPHKFEAGTVNAGGAAELVAAIDYLENLGFEQIRKQEKLLTEMLLGEIKKIPFVYVMGSENPLEHRGIVTFTIDGVHPHDVAAILDADHIAVRAGHHCAQPLMQHMGVTSSTRASLMFYNTEEEVETFISSLKEIRRKMGYAE